MKTSLKVTPNPRGCPPEKIPTRAAYKETPTKNICFLAMKSFKHWPVVTKVTACRKTCRGPEIPRYGTVFFENTGKSGSIMFHETRRVRRVSGTVFSPIRTFSESRKIRSPDTSLKRGVSRPGNCLIRPDLLRITTYRRLAQPIKLSIFTLILCYLWGFDRSSTVLQV